MSTNAKMADFLGLDSLCTTAIKALIISSNATKCIFDEYVFRLRVLTKINEPPKYRISIGAYVTYDDALLMLVHHIFCATPTWDHLFPGWREHEITKLMELTIKQLIAGEYDEHEFQVLAGWKPEYIETDTDSVLNFAGNASDAISAMLDGQTHKFDIIYGSYDDYNYTYPKGLTVRLTREEILEMFPNELTWTLQTNQ